MEDSLSLESPPGEAPGRGSRFYVVSYDVTDMKRRNKIAKTLLGFGERVQYSVFECILDDAQYHDLRRRLDKWIKTDEDSVRYYNLGAVKQADVEVQGLGTVTEVPLVYIV